MLCRLMIGAKRRVETALGRLASEMIASENIISQPDVK
jgi:hypothetical protein